MANQLVQFYRQSRPDDQRSDDEITLHYATSYGDRIDQLSSDYPDWRSDFDRIMGDSAKSQLTAGDYAKNFAGRVVKGAASTIATLPEAVGIAARGLDQRFGSPGGIGLGDNLNSTKPQEDYATTQLGAKIRELGDRVAPETQPVLDSSFWNATVPDAIGSAGGFAATGAVGGVGGKAVQTASIALAGAAAQGVEQFKDALAHGADDDTALKAFILGGIVGTSEIVPLNRMMNRLDGVSGGAFSKAVVGSIRRKLSPAIKKGVEVTAEAAKDAFEESVQEAFQSAAGNEIASSLLKYDKDRKVTDGLAQDAAAGGVTGVVMSLLTQAIGHARAPKSRQAEEAAKEGAPAAPPAEEQRIDRSIGMGLDQTEIQDLAAKVAVGAVAKEEAVASIEQASDKAKFEDELGRMAAIRGASPAPMEFGRRIGNQDFEAGITQAPSIDGVQTPIDQLIRHGRREGVESGLTLDQPAEAPAELPVGQYPPEGFGTGTIPDQAEVARRDQARKSAEDRGRRKAVAARWKAMLEADGVDTSSMTEDQLADLQMPGATAAEPIAPAVDDGQDARYAEIHTKIDRLVEAGSISEEDGKALATAVDDHRTAQLTGGSESTKDIEALIQSIEAAPMVPRPAATTDQAQAAKAVAARQGLSPIVAEAERFSGSESDSSEASSIPSRIDSRISELNQELAELTAEDGPYQREFIGRKPGAKIGPVQRRVSAIESEINRLADQKQRGAGKASRDVLFDPNSLFLEATGLINNDATKTGAEAHGAFTLDQADQSSSAELGRQLFAQYQAATTLDEKLAAADRLASHLAAQGLEHGGDRSLSRRVGLFALPDGRVLATLIKDTGLRRGSAPMEGRNPGGSPKRGSKFKTSIPKAKSGQAGRPGFYSVADLLEGGAQPVGSVRLVVPRSTLNHVYSAGEFSQLKSLLVSEQTASTQAALSGADALESRASASGGTDVVQTEEPSYSDEPPYPDNEFTPSHGAAIFATFGGGELSEQDARDVLRDGLESETATDRVAFQSLVRAALNYEQGQKGESVTESDIIGRAEQWLAEASRGPSGESGFAGRIVSLARVDSGGGGGAQGGADQAASATEAEAGRSGDSAGSQQGSGGAHLSPLEWSEREGRFRRSEATAPRVEVDLASGTARAGRVLPTTADGAVANLRRAHTSKVLVEAQALSGGLQNALARIAEQTPSPLLKRLAASLAPSAPNVPIEQKTLPGAYGYWSGSSISIDPAAHKGVEDLHRTVLEEAVHSVTAGWWAAYQFARDTMAPGQVRLMDRISAIMEESKAAGLKWQDMASPDASFDEFIAATKTDEKFRSALQGVGGGGTSLWVKFRQWVGDLLRTLVGSGPVERSLVGEIDSLVQQMVDGGAMNRADGGRYRKVDGYLGAGSFESTADSQFDPRPEAGIAAAIANHVSTIYDKMLAAYKSASSLAGPLDPEAFLRFIHETAGMGGADSPVEILDAIDAELARQGLPTPSIRSTTLADLDNETRRPVAMREAVISLQKLQQAIASRFQAVTEAFDAERDRLAKLKTEVYETTRQYTSLDHTQKLLLEDLRRALRETDDRGTGAILKELGVADPATRKAAIETAAKRAAASPSSFVDTIEALAMTGVDFGGLRSGATKLTDVVSAVASSSDPRLSWLTRDAASFSIATNFAKRHSLLMDLLPARSTPDERRALDTMVKLATSDRSDAFDAAVKELGQLKKLGARGARILEQLKLAKAELGAQSQLVDRYTRILDAHPEVAPVLQSEIEALQSQLAAEYGAEDGGNRQWSPAQGAIYYVPESDSTKPEALLAHGESNPHRKVVDLGEGFSLEKMRVHHQKILSWLAANPGFQGPGRALLERMVSRDAGLLTVTTDHSIRNIKLNLIDGIIFRYFGDLGVRLQTLGTHGGSEAAKMLRNWVGKTEAFGRGKDLAAGSKADGLLHSAMKATGIEHPDDFRRRFHSDPLAYLETRADLNAFPAGATEEEVNKAAIQAINSFFDSRPEDKALFDRNPKARKAVIDYLSQVAKNNSMVQSWVKRLGLKIRDEDGGFYRKAIGRSWFTMSRMVGREIRNVVREMAPTWATPVPWDKVATVDDAAKAMGERFSSDVWKKFFLPMAHKTGKSLFNGPENGGAVDRARRANVVAAAAAAEGDFVKFATTLYALEGGVAGGELAFIKSTYATTLRFFRQLNEISQTRDVRAEGDEIGRTFLDGRQGSDYPAEWLDYRTYGRYDLTRYARILAAQSALGTDGADFRSSLTAAERDLTKLAAEYGEYAKMEAGPAKDGELKRLEKTGNLTAYKNAAKNLEELKRITHDFDALWNEYRGDPAEYRALTRTLGTISGLLVQGASTTLVDTVTLFESPLRKMGIGNLALSMIADNVKGAAGEFFGSLLQAFGKELALGSEWSDDTAAINHSGLADPDAYLDGYRSQYEAGVSGLPSVGESFRRGGLGSAGVNVARRATEAASSLISTGIGKTVGADGGYATFKPLAPFTMGSQFQHRAAARGWLRATRRLVNKGAEYLRAHPEAARDPGFKFTYESLGGNSTFGLFGSSNRRGFDTMVNLLESSGISLEEAARNMAAGKPAVTEAQRHAIIALAQSETMLNSSPVTRPTGSTGVRGLIANPVVAPLLGWSISKMVDVAKTTRDPNVTTSARGFASALTTMALAVLPLSLAYAWLRDEYDEVVVGKAPNVQPFTWDNAGPALVDKIDRIGTLGLAGGLVNSWVNFDTAKDFTADSRILALNTIHSLSKAVGTLVRQGGDVDYAGFYRPLLSSLGGAGYLQNFDAINNVVGVDNAESRVIRRINVGNLIRASAKAVGVEARSAKFGGTSPSPIKPYVNQMVLAAYANDPSQFRLAWRKAVDAARDDGDVGEAEARKKVASAYSGQNPVQLAMARRPTEKEWRSMLGSMGSTQRAAVESAIRYFLHYGETIGASARSVTAAPAKPAGFPKLAVDWRSMATTRLSY